MNFKEFIWNKENYQQYISYLKSLQDNAYKEFHSNLTETKYEIIGIRVPIMRSIAKEIFTGNYLEYLKIKSTNYYEEIMIKGFIIAKIKDIKLLKKHLLSYSNLVDNWAICDSFCNSLKIVSKNKNEFITIIKKLLASNKEFKVRIALILLLSYYVDDEYIDYILNVINEINSEEYYIKMAQAWLLCECFIKEKDKTLKYLKNNNLNKFVQNKAISKIHDSYRVSKEEKEYLNSLRK